MTEQQTREGMKIMSEAHANRAHSEVMGGSSAGRIIACPGSWGLAKTLPKPESSSYAEEGTALHEAISYLLNSEEPLDPDDLIGMEFNDHVIDQGQVVEAIIPALDAFDEYIDEIEEQDGSPFSFVVEQRVEMPGIPESFGSADLVGVTAKRSVVLDWKFGSGVPVSATENAQGKYYGRASMHSLADFFPANKKPDWKVDIIVAQPRLGVFDVWPTTIGALEAFRLLCVAKVIEAKSADPSFAEGDHCKWCPAKVKCPLKNKALFGVGMDAAEYREGGGELTLIDYDPDSMAAKLDLFKSIEDFIADFKAYAHRAMEQHNVSIPGWKIVEKRATRKWLDEKNADKYLTKQGLKIDARRPRTLISPAAAEKLLKPLVKKIPDEYAKGVSSGTTLAPSDDTRAEIKPLGEGLTNAAERASELANTGPFKNE
jgi:hypothetical protein